MFTSRVAFFSIILFSSFAAPVPTEWNNDLVIRAPTKTFAHAAEAARIAAKINKNVAPRPDGSVFWFGRRADHHSHTVSVLEDARKIAKHHGKETLNDHLERKKLHIPDHAHNPHSEKLWNIASTAFAHRSKGDTHAYLGTHTRPDSVYRKHEKPALMDNHHVPKLTEHHLPHGPSYVVKGRHSSHKK